jgi:hypothetical protein
MTDALANSSMLLLLCLYSTGSSNFVKCVPGWMDGWMDGWMEKQSKYIYF